MCHVDIEIHEHINQTSESGIKLPACRTEKLAGYKHVQDVLNPRTPVADTFALQVVSQAARRLQRCTLRVVCHLHTDGYSHINRSGRAVVQLLHCNS